MSTEKAIYKMPKINIGDTILWFPGGDARGESTPGLVTKVGEQALTIAIVPAGGMNIVAKDAVRHLGDPSLQRSMEIREQGGWDYTESSRLTQELAGKLEDILLMLKKTKT